MPHAINSIISSPTKFSGVNTSVQRPRTTHPVGSSSNIISPVSNILSVNGELILNIDVDSNALGRIKKRRSVSAAIGSATTFVSLIGKNSRGARTNSSSVIPMRSKSSTQIINTKRSHSPSSMSLMSSSKNSSQRKKQKFSHYWALFGKSEQRLVSIDVNYFICIVQISFHVDFRLTNRRYIANVTHRFDMLKKKTLSNLKTVFFYGRKIPKKAVFRLI